MMASPVPCSIYTWSQKLLHPNVDVLDAFKWAREQTTHVVVIVRERDMAVLGGAGPTSCPTGASLAAWGVKLRGGVQKAAA